MEIEPFLKSVLSIITFITVELPFNEACFALTSAGLISSSFLTDIPKPPSSFIAK